MRAVLAALFAFIIGISARGATSQRVLHFPSVPVGKILVMSAQGSVLNKRVGGKFLAMAQGEVVVPPSSRLLFLANEFVLTKMPIFNNMPPDAFECLVIKSMDLNDVTVAPLAHLTGLRHLEIGETEITDNGQAKLAPLVNLEFLSIEKTMITGKALGALRNMTKLQYLDLTGNELSPDCYKYLAQFPNLEWVLLRHLRLTDRDLAVVAKGCGKARWLTLTDNMDLSDRGVKHLAGLKYLKTLDLRNTRATAGGIMALKNCPLKCVKLDRQNVSDAQFQELKKIFPGIMVLFDERSTNVDQSVFSPLH